MGHQDKSLQAEEKPKPVKEYSHGLVHQGKSLLAKDWLSAEDVPVMEDSGIPPPNLDEIRSPVELFPNSSLSMVTPFHMSNAGRVLPHFLTRAIRTNNVWVLRQLMEHNVPADRPLKLLEKSVNLSSREETFQPMLLQVLNNPQLSARTLAFLAENTSDLNMVDSLGTALLDKLLERLTPENLHLLPAVIYLIRRGAKSNGPENHMPAELPDWAKQYILNTLANPPPLDKNRSVEQRLPARKTSYQSNLPPISRLTQPMTRHGFQIRRNLERNLRQQLTNICKMEGSQDHAAKLLRTSIEEGGFDINTRFWERPPNSETLLDFILIQPPFTILTFLVENGFDLHSATSEGKPFLLQFLKGSGKEEWCRDILRYLVEHGAPVDANLLNDCTSEEYYPLLMELYRETLPHWDENELIEKDDKYWEKLRWEYILKEGTLQSIQTALQKGNSPDERLPESKLHPLLLVAKRTDHLLEAYRLLEDFHATLPENQQETLLRNLLSSNSESALQLYRYLIAEKHLPVTYAVMRNAVFRAVSNESHLEVLKWLLEEQKIPVDAQFQMEENGKTQSLWRSISNFSWSKSVADCYRYLFQKGYSMPEKDLDWTWEAVLTFPNGAREGQPEVIRLLAKQGAPSQSLLTEAIRRTELWHVPSLNLARTPEQRKRLELQREIKELLNALLNGTTLP